MFANDKKGKRFKKSHYVQKSTLNNQLGKIKKLEDNLIQAEVKGDLIVKEVGRIRVRVILNEQTGTKRYMPPVVNDKKNARYRSGFMFRIVSEDFKD